MTRINTICLKALVERHLLLLIRDPWQLLNILYKSILDLVLIGYIGVAQQKLSACNTTDYTPQLLMGIICWSLVMRISFSAIHGLLVDIWSGNIVALFATPVKMAEWVISLMVYALIVASALMILLAGMSYVLFNFNLYSVGWILAPLLSQFFVFGMALGAALVGLTFYSGMRGQSLVFMVGYLFVPFVGAYYPVSVLPGWMQALSHILGPRYLFEFARAYIAHGIYEWHLFAIGSLLNVLALVGALLFLYNRYKDSCQKGLYRLSD